MAKKLGLWLVPVVALWPAGAWAQRATTTSLLLGSNPAQIGQQVQITAQVYYTTSVTGIFPGGTVQFTSGGTAILGCETRPLTPTSTSGYANATCTTTFPQAGSYSIGAQYSGDANSATSSAAAVTLNIQGSAHISFGVGSGYQQIGQRLTLIATVANSAGQPATGTVDFLNAATPLTGCTGVGLVSGAASCSTSFSQVGTMTIGVKYSGDSLDLPATGSWPIDIGKAATTPTAIAVKADGIQYQQYYLSQTITVDVTFQPAQSIPGPTGTVTFSESGKAPVAVQVQSNGYASYTAAFAIGSHTITAHYAGDANYQAADAKSSATFTVTQTATNAYIASNPGSGVYGQAYYLNFGQPVFLGATFPPPPGSVVWPTGSVAFYDGSTKIVDQPIDPTGHAELLLPSDTIPALAVGPHQLKAVYGGDSNYLPSDTSLGINGPLLLTVVQAQVNLVLSAPRFQAGQPLTIYATPVVVSSVGVSLGGTVDFGVSGGTGCTAVALKNGTAACTVTLAQPATVTVTYNGDANTAKASASVTLSTDKLSAGVYTQAMNPAPQYGAYDTLDARVMPPLGGPPPTGTVTFNDKFGGVTSVLGTQQLGSNGHATLNLKAGSSTFALGDGHSVSAAYSGDASYQASSALPVTVDVKRAATTLIYASPPAQIGQPLALAVGIPVTYPGNSWATPMPSGQVDYQGKGAAAAFCMPTPVGGLAQCSQTIASLDTVSPTLLYEGDINTGNSALSIPALPGVKARAGVYSGTLTPNPPWGVPVTVTAGLLAAPGVAPHTGSIAFSDHGASLATVTLTNGQATFQLPALGLGAHQVVALYSGDANYESSAARGLDIVVEKGAGQISICAASPTPDCLTAAQTGRSVTFNASATLLNAVDAHGNPWPVQEGTVDFTIGGSPVAGCTGMAPQNGAVQCTASFAQPGTYVIVAAYSGGDHTSGDAATVQLTVTKPTVSFYLAAYSNSLPYGAGVGIRGLVMGTPNGPTPTGTVTFSDNGATLATVPLGVDGAAPLTIPSGTVGPLGIGTHNFTASYSGDSNYGPLSASNVSVTITRAATNVALYATPPQIDQPVALKAAVTVMLPGVANVTGTLDFSTGGTPIAGCTALPLQNGVAWCNTVFSQLSNVTVTASYNGDTFTAPNSASIPLAVGKAAAGMYVAADSMTLPFGAPLTISALVQAAGGVAPPTGTVTFSEGASTLAVIGVGADGRASLFSPSAQVKALAVGPHTITAAYSGDTNYQPSSPGSVTVTVGKASTTLAVASTPPQIGQPVTLKAAVTVIAPANATPSGTVDFTGGGAPVKGCTGLPLQNGIATCVTTFAQLGTLAITATYSGDAQTASNTAGMQLAVGKALAGMYVAADSTNPPYGATVTMNALLQAADGVVAPTGSVTFSDGGSTLAAAAVGADGRASLVGPLPLGPHSIVAAYSGDMNYQPFTAAAVSVTVSKAAVTVAVASTPAQLNQSVTLKAAVTVNAPGVAAPAGTVDFTNNGSTIAYCIGIPLKNGVALCTTSFSTLGTYSITARYNGDADTTGASATLQLTAGKAVAGIYAASSPTAPVFGVPVTVRALLMGASGVPAPTGSVTFTDGSATVGSAPVAADGHATLNLAAGSLTAGQHIFTAAYAGDTNYAGGSAASLTLTVGRASTTTTLSAGFGIPLTAAVAVIAPAAGTPTGSVQFFISGVPVGTAPLAARNGTFSATLPAGTWSGNGWAVYQGDANFSGSASASVNLTAAAVVTLTSDRNPAATGQPIAFTAAVAAASGGIAPTGRVQFSVDGVSLGSAAVTSGNAALTAPAGTLAAGSHTVTATYSGDSVYPAASCTLTQVVTKNVVTLTLTANPPTAVYGQPVTFTAQLPAGAGSVQFSDGNTALGSAAIASGVAILTPSNLAAGTHSITALWAGDAATSAASAAPLAYSVAKAQTAVILTSSGLALTATVAAAPPGVGTPSGTVRLLDAATGSTFGTAILTSGAAVVSQPATADAIVAIYSGDSNFAGSTSLPLTPLAAVNAASFASDTFAPDEIVTLFGTSLSPTTVVSTNNPAPSLGGTTAWVTDSAGMRRPANLLFVSPSQASIVLPAAIPDGPAVIAIANAAGATLSTPVTITRTAPGLFTADGSGKGAPVGQILRFHPDGSQDTPLDLNAAPIDLGDPADSIYLVLYGTGIRHQTAATAAFTCNTCIAGDLPVAFAGAQPSVAGLDQVNLLLPASLRGAGQTALTLTVNGTTSNPVNLTFN